MGRNLLVPGMTWAGHVGITISMDTNSRLQVIEAMNELPAIQINEIGNFKSRSTYWGSRHGTVLESFPLKLIKAAYWQRTICPQYTILSLYTPGIKDKNGTIKQCAKFRCDTFVNYIFHVGGYDLPTYTGLLPTFPSNVFYSFPLGHGDGPFSYAKPDSLKMPLKSFHVENLKNINEMSLDKLISYLHSNDKKITKPNINNLWKLAINTEVENEKRLLLIDYIGSEGNIESITKLIEAFYRESKTPIKSMLLRATQDLYQKHIETVLNSDYDMQLQKFYTDLLYDSSLKTNDFSVALRGFIKFSSDNIINAHLDKVDFILTSSEINLPDSIIVELELNLAMKSSQLEKIFIPKILNHLQDQNDPDLDDTFNRYIINMLANSGLNLFEKPTKQLVSAYLNTRNPEISNSSGLFNHGVWLEATALTNSTSFGDAGKFIADYLGDKTIDSQALYIIGLSENNYIKNAYKSRPVFKKFKNEVKELNDSLVNPNILPKKKYDQEHH